MNSTQATLDFAVRSGVRIEIFPIGFLYASTTAYLPLPRVHVECDVLGALRYDDELTVEARVEREPTVS